MVEITARLPAKNLPIRRILAKLFQSFVYNHLDGKEHRGYMHTSGKIFKSMNFKIVYIKDKIYIKYCALNKVNEKRVAMAVLTEGLKLGDIHIAQTEISLIDRAKLSQEKLKIKGYVAAAIKDGKSNKKIYLEPKSAKFQEIVHTHTLQKYETLLGKSYEDKLKINLLHQSPKYRTFFYQKAPIRSWHGIYEIEAKKDMMEMILDTGLGAHTMQGLGFVEVVE